MKRLWVKVDGWNKDLITTALESGADALVLDEGLAERVRELGRISVVAPDGDVLPGSDVLRIAVKSKDDERRAAAAPRDQIVVLALEDWAIIPLENLIAQRDNLLVEVADADGARTALQTLEKGSDGVVTTCQDAAEVRKIAEIVREGSENVELVEAQVTAVKTLGMGDRVCVDTCSNMSPGEGMLVGNASSAFLLVHAETLENPYVAPRPFRVNAGAVHAYVMAPGGATRYLSELLSGDEVLVVNADGHTRTAYVGRAKVERRPLLLVEAEANGRAVNVVLQNAETIRLTQADGGAVSVAALKPGDRILAHVTTGGRHFGMAVEESIDER